LRVPGDSQRARAGPVDERAREQSSLGAGGGGQQELKLGLRTQPNPLCVWGNKYGKKDGHGRGTPHAWAPPLRSGKRNQSNADCLFDANIAQYRHSNHFNKP
jgi:hypothetical protein